jgi:CRP-like cAMP-binding protein
LRVCTGEIEVLREVGPNSIVLGHVREGEWLGEMGVIENRTRSATACAATDSTVESMSAQAFLDRVSADPGLAHALIMRLSIRLRKLEDRIAGSLLPVAPAALPEGRDGTVSGPIIADVTLAAETDALRARIGDAPIRITSLPYVVGRRPAVGEGEPPRHPNLLIEDEAPFRLSRDHFMIQQSHDQLIISDLGSTLGTIVNGRAIGHHFMRDAVPLQRGENHIIAGGRGSPFEFLVSVG